MIGSDVWAERSFFYFNLGADQNVVDGKPGNCKCEWPPRNVQPTTFRRTLESRLTRQTAEPVRPGGAVQVTRDNGPRCPSPKNIVPKNIAR